MYSVKIKPVLNGYQVRVGCQTVVFTTMAELLEELETYLNDPDGTIKIYQENSLNAKFVAASQPTIRAGNYFTSAGNILAVVDGPSVTPTP